MQKKVLMGGNVSIAEGAILAGCRAYFGYPITPQNEILEHLSKRLPEMGRVFIQTEVVAAERSGHAPAHCQTSMRRGQLPGTGSGQIAGRHRAGGWSGASPCGYAGETGGESVVPVARVIALLTGLIFE